MSLVFDVISEGPMFCENMVMTLIKASLICTQIFAFLLHLDHIKYNVCAFLIKSGFSSDTEMMLTEICVKLLTS